MVWHMPHSAELPSQDLPSLSASVSCALPSCCSDVGGSFSPGSEQAK